ncbi:hypothetical protein PV08_11056 [Exophiala spinifera]|uniref:Uncharacterized protein n=1 Tax=Exophiala spinifera TaxID=91928 RepID=A0A0D1Y598_9EURO|nr:uncharacterized protein PV08_11056 [Exophiala spinifera]KIW10096.1 hypothetical protein PV08_11056 [Exophiala spinifera]
MSVTTTENQVSYSIAQTLREYDVHHSNQEAEDAPLETPTNLPTSRNPTNWPTSHRRVPPYRPVNRNLDLSVRGTANAVEAAFVFTMLHGVWINAAASQFWRKTGGRINDKYFRYKIGGEW